MSPRTEKWVKALMTLAVLAVAIFAAIQSYTHHYDLAQSHHESGASLRLYPLSVDWLMLAAGLVYLYESHKSPKRPKLPMAVLVVGILATLAGNIAALWIYGPVAVLIGAWGPVCLVLTIEMGMYLVRSMSAKPEPDWQPFQFTHGSAEADEITKAERLEHEGVPAPDALQGWGQLRQPGLDGIGLAPRGR